MQLGTTTTRVRGPVRTVDRDRFFPFFISTIANKVSRGGSRVYLRLFGIGIIEWRILYALAADPNLSANAICSRIDLDKAAASRSIQVLERQKLDIDQALRQLRDGIRDIDAALEGKPRTPWPQFFDQENVSAARSFAAPGSINKG